MKLIVGLGNPGEEYAQTRHNIGFMVVDKLGRELGSDTGVWQEEKKHRALVARAGDVVLVKPLTFMNASGKSVQSILAYYKLQPSDLWVVHDDIDLPLGKIRIRQMGGTGGHHGIESIMHELATDKFIRFRLGIGKGKESIKANVDRNLHHRSVIHFVLSRFTRHEAGGLKHLVKHGMEAVRTALLDGIDKTMMRFN